MSAFKIFYKYYKYLFFASIVYWKNEITNYFWSQKNNMSYNIFMSVIVYIIIVIIYIFIVRYFKKKALCQISENDS